MERLKSDVAKVKEGMDGFKNAVKNDMAKVMSGKDSLKDALREKTTTTALAVSGLKEKVASGSTSLSLSAVSDIEKLAQKRGKNTAEERFRVVPEYAYPNTRLNRHGLRKEMNKKSSYFHDLRLEHGKTEEPIGRLTVEILQCFGLPKPDLLGEASAFCILVCGSYAFKTDVMPPVANPMWLSKMRRACIFPIHHAYARLYVGVFGQEPNEKKDGFAGRIVVDIARLRPGCTYDVTLPLRESAHVYSRHHRGAIRLRFHLKWKSERKALLSYLPKKVPKFEPNESVTVQCCDTKSFQNVARVVHGVHMPGKFSRTQLQATIREINFTRIHILRYLRKREVRNLVQWNNPIISGFVFLAWMHSVYSDSVAYVPGHLVTYLLLHLWKNYATYATDSPIQNGFLAPTWEEMFAALLMGTGKHNCIAPLEMEQKDESTVRSASQDLGLSMRSSTDHSVSAEESVPLKEIAEAFRKGVKVENLRYRLRTYHNAFRGSDAVDFLVSSGYASSRVEAVTIGQRLAKEMKLFEHVVRQHEFKDTGLFYNFLANDINKYVITTHRPWGKTLFRTLGFTPSKELTEAEAHLEMPYADGVDHPRFTVKESLVIRSRESQRLLSQETHEEDREEATPDVDQGLYSPTWAPSTRLASWGALIEEEDDKTEVAGADDNEDDEDGDDGESVAVEVKMLNKPPQQDIDFKKKADKKMPVILAEARHKAHGTLLHLFNDRVYKIEPTGIAISSSRRGIRKKISQGRVPASPKTPNADWPEKDPVQHAACTSLKASMDEHNKLLSVGKYSVGNPLLTRVGVIVQPIIEIILGWLCLFRALFNVFTWRDPILSFWVSITGPVVVVVLYIFPWRFTMAIAGILFVGPQNWLLRVRRERKEGVQPYDPDKVVKKKKKKQAEAEAKPLDGLPLFSMFAPDNRPVDISDDVDPTDVRKIVVPYSPLMYQRFYDWPPEHEYARVRAEEPPSSDPNSMITMMKQYSRADSSVSSLHSQKSKRSPTRRILKVVPRLLRRKKNHKE